MSKISYVKAMELRALKYALNPYAEGLKKNQIGFAFWDCPEAQRAAATRHNNIVFSQKSRPDVKPEKPGSEIDAFSRSNPDRGLISIGSAIVTPISSGSNRNSNDDRFAPSQLFAAPNQRGSVFALREWQKIFVDFTAHESLLTRKAA